MAIILKPSQCFAHSARLECDIVVFSRIHAALSVSLCYCPATTIDLNEMHLPRSLWPDSSNSSGGVSTPANCQAATDSRDTDTDTVRGARRHIAKSANLYSRERETHTLSMAIQKVVRLTSIEHIKNRLFRAIAI